MSGQDSRGGGCCGHAVASALATLEGADDARPLSAPEDDLAEAVVVGQALAAGRSSNSVLLDVDTQAAAVGFDVPGLLDDVFEAPPRSCSDAMRAGCSVESHAYAAVSMAATNSASVLANSTTRNGFLYPPQVSQDDGPGDFSMRSTPRDSSMRSTPSGG